LRAGDCGPRVRIRDVDDGRFIAGYLDDGRCARGRGNGSILRHGSNQFVRRGNAMIGVQMVPTARGLGAEEEPQLCSLSEHGQSANGPNFRAPGTILFYSTRRENARSGCASSRVADRPGLREVGKLYRHTPRRKCHIQAPNRITTPPNRAHPPLNTAACRPPPFKIRDAASTTSGTLPANNSVGAACV
jgi:hypothetical protein